MKRYAGALLLTIMFTAIFTVVPCQAQFMKQLEQTLLGGQNQGLAPGQQPQVIGNVSLPPGQYMITNMQTGQAVYVGVQNGQMFLVEQPVAPSGIMPGQGYAPQNQPAGVGGMIRGGLTNFLNNKLAPQQVPPQ